MYKNNDIVHFENPGSMITTGIIDGDSVIKKNEKFYNITDLGSIKHFKRESEIIKCVGTVYINGSKRKAEELERRKLF